MQDKRGIKIKTKQPSLVDNLFSFFKKENLQNQNQIQNNQINMDVSPRSTTPRKKIFDKSPEKAGKINFTPNRKNNSQMVQFNFKNQPNRQNLLQNKNSYSPGKLRFISTPVQTQYNRLILDNSHSTVVPQNIISRAPQKTYLNDDPSNNSVSQIQVNSHGLNQNKNFIPHSDKTLQSEVIKKTQKELEHHKRLNQELKKQNQLLKRTNQKNKQEIENLKKQIKSYQMSRKAMQNVEVMQLQAPKSPFDKKSYANESKQGKYLFDDNDQLYGIKKQNKKAQMKQSIPIMPQIAHQYDEKYKQPKMEEMSLMSINLKNISQESSFISDQPSFQQLSKEIKKANKTNNVINTTNAPTDFSKNKVINAKVLSPLMEKTVYEKTMKPQQVKQKEKKEKKDNNYQQKQQVTFSKTIGYIRGDQPSFSEQRARINNIFDQQNRQKIIENKNPFQKIATQSNKFYFRQQNHLNTPSNNSFKVIQHKPNKSRQWLMFNEDESSLQYSNNISSKGKLSNNPFDSLDNPFKKSKSIGKSKSQFEDMSSNMNKSNNNNSKLKIEASKTYRFADFDLNEEQSNVDFF